MRSSPSLLFSLPLGEAILVHKSPLFGWGVCHHLPPRLIWEIMPSSLLHEGQEMFLYYPIVRWFGKVEPLWLIVPRQSFG
jgi:hypothetical protein